MITNIGDQPRQKSMILIKLIKAKWKITSNWSPCSASCLADGNEPFKSRSVDCFYNDKQISKRYCSDGDKPSHWTACSTNEIPKCQPEWTISDWGPCSVTCGRGLMIRTVDCQADRACGLKRPETTKVCDLGTCTAKSCKDIQRLRKMNLNGNYYIEVSSFRLKCCPGTMDRPAYLGR